MRRQRITFFLLGSLAGVVCVLLGASSPVILAYGVGPLFFAAVVTGTTITGGWTHVQVGVWRFVACLLISTISYVLALFAFSVVAGFAPDWFGVATSYNLVDFKGDVFLGLIAAGIVAATGISMLNVLLTGTGSGSLLLRLLLAALITIVVTFIINLFFHSYWSFIGVLFTLGSGLFCCLVGQQICSKTKRISERTAVKETKFSSEYR